MDQSRLHLAWVSRDQGAFVLCPVLAFDTDAIAWRSIALRSGLDLNEKVVDDAHLGPDALLHLQQVHLVQLLGLVRQCRQAPARHKATRFSDMDMLVIMGTAGRCHAGMRHWSGP